MREIGRLIAMAMVFGAASCAWLTLGGIMVARTETQHAGLRGAVADLWGVPLRQAAPTVSYAWHTQDVEGEEPLYDARGELMYDERGHARRRKVMKWRTQTASAALDATDVDVSLHLDPRRKGLMWFALYDVDFAGSWGYTHDGPPATATFQFAFPLVDGVYDDFRVHVDGVERADVVPANGRVEVTVPVDTGQQVRFAVGYTSRGMDEWTYEPVPRGQVGQLTDFSLTMATDFRAIDFPAYTISPSTRSEAVDGWTLDWSFRRLVTGHAMGMTMPQRIQPGPLAAAMSFSAPISLALFTAWIYVLGLLRGLDIHPVNHLFLAAAFFAFHLLFGYTADHLPVESAFALSAATSVALVVSYLRLVVGPRFAIREAGLAQLLYLVGFSLAHFFDGYTGLTVTVLGVLTLFALMQLTGRIRWSDVFAGRPAHTATAAPSTS